MIVAIPNGEVLESSIPNSKMKLLQAWIELHKDELVADVALLFAAGYVKRYTPSKKEEH